MMTTKFISFRLEADTAERFRKAVFERYGGLYGFLQRELNRAVEERIPLLLKEIELAKKSKEG
jgi:hypothetical protein